MPSDSVPPDSVLMRIEHVDRTYWMGEVPVPVLRDVSLEIYRGELLAVVGPSGSGKTTILNLIGGLDRPSSGRVFYGDLDLTEADDRTLTRYRRNHVGFIFQFYNLVQNLTARENVMAAAEIAENGLDVDEVLDLVGLSDRKDHFPSQLSGGEQQRVAIARAVAKNPDLLLCDEPTGALDLATGKRVLRLLVDLNEKLEKTVVVITHNAALADVAHRVVHIGSGQIRDVVVNHQPLAPEEVTW